MRTLESNVGHTRRRIRTLLVLGSLLAVLTVGGGVLLFVLGRPRPDVTLTFAEFGEYLAGFGVLHLVLYAGLFWQIGRLSRRQRPPSGTPAATLPAAMAEP